MKLWCSAVVATILVMSPSGMASAAPARPSAPKPADLASAADAIVRAAYPSDGPGAAVVIMRHGRVAYASGRGLADVERRRSITPATPFRMASITKQFTAAVILQLVDEGRISLDDPLSRFFPDYPSPGAGATVRQLLNHTSGIQSYTFIPGWWADPAKTNRPYTTAEMIAQFRDQPVTAQPGEAWLYNNSGYVLLGAIIELKTGMPWYQAVEERIARPLGLSSVTYERSGKTVPGLALGYIEESGRRQLARPMHMSVPHAAGGLVGTVGDLAKWGSALHHGRVVSPALYQEMIRPTQLRSGMTEPYGLGLALYNIRGHAAIGHAGGFFGYNTDSAYVPADDLFIAVFANSDEPATSPEILLRRLAALALGKPHPELRPVKLDRRLLEPLLGTYSADDGSPSRRFFVREGRLYTARGSESEYEAFPAGDDRFFYGPGSLSWFKIERKGNGAHVMHMDHVEAAAAERMVRVVPSSQ